MCLLPPLKDAAAETLTGWSSREARRRPLGEVFRLVEGETRRPIEGRFEACLRGEGHPAGSGEMLLIARGESEAPVEGRVTPIRDGRGQITGIVGVFSLLVGAGR
jgi:PAS domain S-box-containing protein